MPEISLNDSKFTYTLKPCKRRKTIQLKLTAYNKIEISLPSSARNINIHQILLEKAAWILSKSANLKSIDEVSINSTIFDGCELLFLGRPYTLKVIINKIIPANIDLQGETIFVTISEATDNCDLLISLLMNWYKKNASTILNERTWYWAKRLNVSPIKVNLKDQKTRWGSCSSRGTINYNWRIIMAPPDVLDYLVIHELCHLVFPNHSQNFWQLVGLHCPSYNKYRSWLKNNGQLLMRLFKIKECLK